MKCSLGIFNFLEEFSSLSHSIVFLYFFALITEEDFLISPHYSLELCIQMGISFLFSFAWRKFRLAVQNEAGQRLIEFRQENTLVIVNTLFQHPREDSIHGHHQMVNTEIWLIIFFAGKDGEALYSQQKEDWELTVAQIMNSLLWNSDLNWRK